MDPYWRMHNLYQIRTKMPGYEGKTVIFQPNEVQREIYQKIEDGKKRIIILKPRKLGTTTGIALYLLDKAMYTPNQMCRTIAHRKQTVQELFNDIPRFAFDRINPVLRPKEKYTTRAELQFEKTGSKYSIDVEARGMTPTILHFSEIAYVDDEQKLEDTLESLPLTALGIAESTANGVGNWFETTFMNNWKVLQEGKEPEWWPMFYAWFDDPMNEVPWKKGTEYYYPDKCKELRAKFKNKDGKELTKEQLLWWDRKKFQLGERMPELYPSTPEEAFIFSTGRVYKEFSEHLNVVPPMEFKDFKVSADFGQTNPMCFLLIHQDHDGNHIVFKEFYQRECPIDEACKWLRKQGIKKVHFADPSMHFKTQAPPIMHRHGEDHRKSVSDIFREHGVKIAYGTQNDVMAGIARVRQYLRFDPEHIHPYKRDEKNRFKKGAPRLFITEDCHNLIKEFGLYRWPKDPQGGLNAGKYETPRKENDHAMDALRYYVLSHAKPLIADEEAPRPGTPRYFLAQKRNRKRSVVY